MNNKKTKWMKAYYPQDIALISKPIFLHFEWITRNYAIESDLKL